MNSDGNHDIKLRLMQMSSQDVSVSYHKGNVNMDSPDSQQQSTPKISSSDFKSTND